MRVAWTKTAQWCPCQACIQGRMVVGLRWAVSEPSSPGGKRLLARRRACWASVLGPVHARLPWEGRVLPQLGGACSSVGCGAAGQLLCPQVDVVNRGGEKVPVSVWMKRLRQETRRLRCVVVLEPVERLTAWVAFQSDVSTGDLPCSPPAPVLPTVLPSFLECCPYPALLLSFMLCSPLCCSFLLCPPPFTAPLLLCCLPSSPPWQQPACLGLGCCGTLNLGTRPCDCRACGGGRDPRPRLPQGTITECDSIFAALHGYTSVDELVGQGLTDLILSAQLPPPGAPIPQVGALCPRGPVRPVSRWA